MFFVFFLHNSFFFFSCKPHYYKSIIMKSLVVTLLLLLLQYNTFSQTFEKNISTSLDEFVYDAVVISNNEIVFPINYGYYSNSSYQSALIRMNSNTGEIIDSVHIAFDNPGFKFNGIGSLFYIGDSLIVAVGGCVNYSNNDFQIFISQFNNDLLPVMDTIIGNTENNDSFYDVIFTNDNQLVFVGNESYHNMLIQEISLYGEVIRRKVYYVSDALLSSTIFDDGERYHIYHYFDNDHSYDLLRKTDLEIDTTLVYPSGFLPRNAVAIPDQDYYFVAGRQNNVSPVVDNLSYLKVAQSGELLQQVELFTDTIGIYTLNCFSYNSESLYFSGAHCLSWEGAFIMVPEQRWIMLYKLSYNGDVKWQHFYKGKVNYMPYKILATDDGGALIFSTKYDWNDPIPNQRDVHILKVDSTGWYEGMPVGISEQFSFNQVLVYPNPVNDKVHFVLGLYNNLELNIYNVSGELVHNMFLENSKTLDLSFLQSGVYIYNLKGENGFFEKGKIIKQ